MITIWSLQSRRCASRLRMRRSSRSCWTCAAPARDQKLMFTTNVGDDIVAGPEHAIRVVTTERTMEPAPYIHVRGGLDAKISRNVFYQLVELAGPGEREFAGQLGVWSEGLFFPIGNVP